MTDTSPEVLEAFRYTNARATLATTSDAWRGSGERP